MLNIIIDENISYASEAFAGFGKIRLMPGRAISTAEVKNADALIIRSVTNVNRDLLEGSSVRFVGTATIGTDHVDREYLKKNGVFFTSAKGCNADAVAEWVMTALFYALNKKKITLENKSMGIIGCGNIGSRIAKYAAKIGLNPILNDPPLEDEGKNGNFSALNKALSADIVTLHVPLIKEGQYKTHHLINSGNISLLKKDCIFINASRGPVIDNIALQNYMNLNPGFTALMDVWENEPEVNEGLLSRALVATPHIAGYSLEGKVNGTMIIYRKFCECFGFHPEWKPLLPVPEKPLINIRDGLGLEAELSSAFSHVYDIEEDTLRMKIILELKEHERNEYFDSLRKNYPLRREFNNYTIVKDNEKTKEIRRTLRFNIS